MKRNIRNRLKSRQRRATRRINKANWSGQSPMLACPIIRYEFADRTQAISAGGIGLVRQTGLADSINLGCPVFQLWMPYSEADHVLNIAFNLLAGGTIIIGQTIGLRSAPIRDPGNPARLSSRVAGPPARRRPGPAVRPDRVIWLEDRSRAGRDSPRPNSQRCHE